MKKQDILISLSTFPIFFLVSMGLGKFSSLNIVALCLGIIVFFMTFVKIDVGLYVLIACMLLSPEIIIGHVPGRDIVIRLDDIMIMVVFLAWLARIAKDTQSGFLVNTPLNKYIFFYTLCFSLATIKGVFIDKVGPIKGFFYILKYIEYFFIYFLVSSNLKNRDQVRRFIIMIYIVCLITVIYGVLKIGQVGRISAPFEGDVGEPNTLGGYLVLILSINLGLLFTAVKRKHKFLLLGMIPVILYPFLYTLSRSSYMAITAMYFFFIIFSDKRLLLIGGLFLTIIVMYFFLPEKIADRIMYTFDAQGNPYIKIGDEVINKIELKKMLKNTIHPVQIGKKTYDPDELKKILEEDEKNVVNIDNSIISRSYVERIIKLKKLEVKIGNKVYNYHELAGILAETDALSEAESGGFEADNKPFISHNNRNVTIGIVTLGPSASARIISWLLRIQQWKKEPLFGYGITGAGFIDGQYIKNLVEIGLLGSISFFALMVALFSNSFKIYKKTTDPLYKGLAIGFCAGFFSIVFHAMTANTFILIRIMEPFWFIAAMVMRIPYLEAYKLKKVLLKAD